MKFKLSVFASVSLLSSFLGCAQYKPNLQLSRSVSGPVSSMPVRVAPDPHVIQALSEVESVYANGRTAHGTGQLALASQCYEQVLKSDANHVGALNALAVVYAQTDRADDALALFFRASALAPDAAHIHNNTGYALIRAGRLDEAELALKHAQELDPSNSQTQQNLVLVESQKASATRSSKAPLDVQRVVTKDGIRLVMIAPNVLELQVPKSAAVDARGEVALKLPNGPADTQALPKAAVRVKYIPHFITIPPNTELSGVRLEVSNGSGITKLARRTSDRLAMEGVLTSRLTNAKPYRQLKTEIQFVSGQAQAAHGLQSRMPVAASTVLASRLDAGVQVRLVLGRDMAGKAIAVWLDGEDSPQAIAVMHGGWRWC